MIQAVGNMALEALLSPASVSACTHSNSSSAMKMHWIVPPMSAQLKSAPWLGTAVPNGQSETPRSTTGGSRVGQDGDSAGSEGFTLTSGLCSPSHQLKSGLT